MFPCTRLKLDMQKMRDAARLHIKAFVTNKFANSLDVQNRNVFQHVTSKDSSRCCFMNGASKNEANLFIFCMLNFESVQGNIIFWFLKLYNKSEKFHLLANISEESSGCTQTTRAARRHLLQTQKSFRTEYI